MAIIDLQYNHVGVQSLLTQFADYTAAGQGTMLQHTDGYIYCVFARNYLVAVHERRLYMTRSNDNGVTWASAIEISTGNWDDDPALIQLDVGDVDSDIGVVFNRAETLTRFTFDKETGTATSPYDAITGPITGKKWPSVLHTNTGFLICCLARDSIHSNSQYVFQYTNTTFTTNSWSAASKTVFPANEQPMSLSVKRLVNGHLAMVGAYRTALDGLADTNATTGMCNLPAGILRCDAGVSFSDDEGTTWTTVQNLTNYTGTPALNLVGMLSVASTDLQETSDGKIVVGYQEHTAPQFISTDTTFALPGSLGVLSKVKYHTAKNTLFCGSVNITYGGVFVVNLTAQTVTRIYSGSTPSFWTNDVQTLDISADGNKLAVGLTTGGICILDISDADPSNWTIIKELRTTSTPALPINGIGRVCWDGDTVLYFSYASGAAHWGGRYNTGDNSLVDLHGASSADWYNNNFVVQPGKIVFTQSSTLIAVDKTTGLELYHSHTTYNNNILFYDSINDEYVCLSAATLTRAVDTGSAFTEEQNFTATSTPVWSTGSGSSLYNGVAEIPGYGIFKLAYNSSETIWYQWYSYISKLPAGSRVGIKNQLGSLSLGENVNQQYLNKGLAILNNTWLVMPGSNSIIFQNLTNVGRIRYGYFEYDSISKQLVTAGVDFYDVCNINKVGTNMKALQFPKFCRDADDRLYWYFCRWDMLQTGGNEFAPVLGIIEPDTVKLTSLARIRRGYSTTTSSQSRVQNTYGATLDARIRVVFAQCIKIQARIVPTQERSLTALARIRGQKSSACRISFSIQKLGVTRKLRLQFWANTGYTRNTILTAKAHITQTYSCRMTGHFLVQAVASNTNVNFSVDGTYRQTVSARARILSW